MKFKRVSKRRRVSWIYLTFSTESPRLCQAVRSACSLGRTIVSGTQVSLLDGRCPTLTPASRPDGTELSKFIETRTTFLCLPTTRPGLTMGDALLYEEFDYRSIASGLYDLPCNFCAGSSAGPNELCDCMLIKKVETLCRISARDTKTTAA